MKKLWQKDWQLDTTVEAFETGSDLVMDQKLVWADVAGSIAHATMLHSIGILSAKELSRLLIGLKHIASLAETGKFVLQLGDEDVHTKIEQFLTKQYGEIGKKIHTGRSRNDQLATALKLSVKYQLIQIIQVILTLAHAFLSYATKYEFLPMPGYTHMQKAMPSSVGLWAASFVESLLDDYKGLRTALSIVDQCPLGAAASYGVPLPLDREYTAKLLGFSSVQQNPLYAISGYPKTESVVVAALISVLQTVNKFAADVMLFTTSEFGLFTVADALVTGSSIMPQKKNIDCAELLRSKLHILLGCYTAITGISSNLPSGYNRDFQDAKKPLLESLEISKQSIVIANILLTNLTPHKKNLLAAMTPELFATHTVLGKVQEGQSFREAYQHAVWSVSPTDIVHILHQSKHTGGTGNVGLAALQQKIAAAQKHSTKYTKQFMGAMNTLGVKPV